MIKGIVITHGNLGRELIQVAEKIINEKTDLEYIGFDWQEDGTHLMDKIETYLKKHRNDNIIIFTDMFGGSPANISLKFVSSNIEVITGVNLPSLLKFISHRKRPVEFAEVTRIVKQGAIEGINVLSQYLGEK